MPDTKDLTIATVARGRGGVVTMGNLIAQAAARGGLHANRRPERQIRGGEASCTAASPRRTSSRRDAWDVLVVSAAPTSLDSAASLSSRRTHT